MPNRVGILILALIVLASLLCLLWLPQYLPFASPIDQALRRLEKSKEPKDRLETLLELQNSLKELTLTPGQHEKIVARLLKTADLDPDERVRSVALGLLHSLGEKGKEMQQVLIKALSRSSQEASISVELLPQIADERTWLVLMDAFEQVEDPTVQDRLSRVLQKMPTNIWQELCKRLAKTPKRWLPVVDKLVLHPSSFRSTLVNWALSEDKELSKGALMLLVKFPPTPKESERLKPLANSQDEGILTLVFSVWAQSPSEALAPELRKALSAEPKIAFFASTALLKLGKLKPEEGRKLLNQPYAPLRAQGALALAPSRLVSDWLTLTRALNDPDPEVIRSAAIALIAKGTNGLSIVLKAYESERTPEKRAAMLSAMSGISHPKVIAALVRALRFGDWRERGVALAGLGFHKDKALHSLRQLVNSPAKRDRLAVIDALNAIKTTDALKLLLQMASSDPDEQVRCEALLVLSNHGVKEAIPLLADLVQKGDATIVSTAAFGLTRYGEEGRKVLRRLLNSDRRETKFAAARALATLNDTIALNILKQQANTEDISQRISYLQFMARAGDEIALRELVGFLSHDDPVVRLKARLSLYAVGKPAVPVLLQVLNSPDSKLRAEAALVLGALRVSAAREKLAELLKDEDPKVRETAKAALSRLEGQY